jgi:hypothetical protein
MQFKGKTHMNSISKKWLLSLCALPLLGSGCTTRLGDFTLLATKNIDLSNFQTQSAEQTAPVKGEDSAIQVFGQGSRPDMKEACDRAEDAGHANVLTNAVIESSWWDALVVESQTFTVTGNPVVKR